MQEHTLPAGLNTPDILHIVQSAAIGRLKRYPRGHTLYREGDPVTAVHVVKDGQLKISCVHPSGKLYLYGIVGPGSLLGAEDVLLGRDHASCVETVQTTAAYAIPVGAFFGLLRADPAFCTAVMVQLAQGLACLGTQVWELRFLNVQQRVRNLLARLAAEHGRVTPQGVLIELRITHEEIAEWVGADRSTVTTALKALQEQGYVRRYGRQLLLLSPTVTPAELSAFDPAHAALLLKQFVP